MTTDVSTIPLGGRGSATKSHGLIDEGVHIPPKTPAGDGWSPGKSRVRELGRHKCTLTERHELADRPAVPCHDEGLPTVEGPHDPPTVVSQFTLADPTTHTAKCSTVATLATMTTAVATLGGPPTHS
jgi:hypothetical protein